MLTRVHICWAEGTIMIYIYRTGGDHGGYLPQHVKTAVHIHHDRWRLWYIFTRRVETVVHM